jgi:hypothetical protein
MKTKRLDFSLTENMREKWRHDMETSNSLIETCFHKNVLFLPRQISKFVLTKFQVKNEIPNLKTIKQMLPVPNVLLDCVIWCNFTDFNPKQIKSKIDKHKINNNNTSTKHEFKVLFLDLGFHFSPGISSVQI